jgi:hypothetical protein
LSLSFRLQFVGGPKRGRDRREDKKEEDTEVGQTGTNQVKVKTIGGKFKIKMAGNSNVFLVPGANHLLYCKHKSFGTHFILINQGLRRF